MAPQFVEDGLKEFAETILAEYDAGNLQSSLENNGEGFGVTIANLGLDT